jgi:hypothetical protein
MVSPNGTEEETQMKSTMLTLVKCFSALSLMLGTFCAQAQQPTIILPTSASAPNGIAPIGIGVTATELLFSEPYCQTPNQPRGVFSVTALAPGAPGTLNATVGATPISIPEDGCAENYFVISSGLGGFPLNSVYATDPTSSSGGTDTVYKDGVSFISGLTDTAAGHAGITFDTVGTFANALIVTTPNAIFGYDSTGAQLFKYPAPVTGEFFEGATVAPLSNTACPGCLYITSAIPPDGGGSIFTVAPNTPTGTAPTFLVTVPASGEPEGIQFITAQACTFANTGLSYFVSGYATGPQVGGPISTTGALLGYSPAQLASVVGQALIPLETGGSIFAFNPNGNTFTTFSTPVPIPATTPAQYQLEGHSLAACGPSSSKDRMTGGGSFFTPDGTRVTHGLELHCAVPSHPNNLEINWGMGNNFHLDTLTNVSCFLDPSISAGQPSSDFNTMIGSGTGTLNGAPATITFEFTDAGEPGTSDRASVVIISGTTTFTVPLTVLDNGNQQAH